MEQTVLPQSNSGPVLMVGLGNPGREYRETRHNVGFMAIDTLAEAWGIRVMRFQNKALTGNGMVENRKVILVKPQTFMNLSGEAVAPLARFFKVPPEQVMVFHDDLDLPVGTLRIRPGGGSAGQKGIGSIIDRLGTQNFVRMRIGIGRPPGQQDAASYVLESFASFDRELVKSVLDRCIQASVVFLRSGLDATMNQFNGSILKNE